MLAIVAEGGGMPPRPGLPRPLAPPRPRPTGAPGNAKSGFAALASRMTSSCLAGLRGPYGPYGPAGIGGPGGGRQFGLTPRCETDVKWETSDAAGDLEPSGISS
jgi:hypothetical protein